MRRSLATAVAAAIAATALLAGSASPAPGAYPGRNGLIAFASSRDGLGAGIFTMHTDGTGLARLTGPPPEAVGASFSPDGRTLAFARISDSAPPEVWLAHANGTHLRPLLRDTGAGPSSAPAWSPDGRWIAFVTGTAEHPRISLVRPDGSDRRDLVDGAEPNWSPDAKQIVFTRVDHLPGLWAIGVDGRGLRRLHDGGSPAWSPDERRIAFDKKPCAGCTKQLYAMDAKGDHVRRLTTNAATETGVPAWSPDGKLIAFGECCHQLDPATGPVPSLDVVRPDGSGRRALYRTTNEEFGVDEPAWSPDGRRIAGENLDNGIDVVTLATGRATHLLVDSGPGTPTDTDPAWSPKGTLAYLADGSVAVYTPGAHPATRELGFLAEGGLEWSPDGRLLAFDRNGAIWVYDPRTKRSRRLIANASEAAWSPDGGRIAFVRDVTKTNSEIYVARSDGSGEKRITVNAGVDASPSWQPLR